jgi:hypothetical protein
VPGMKHSSRVAPDAMRTTDTRTARPRMRLIPSITPPAPPVVKSVVDLLDAFTATPAEAEAHSRSRRRS